VEQGTREELLSLCGLDVAGILKQIEKFCAWNLDVALNYSPNPLKIWIA
jgi:hypothetical protein